MSCTIHVYIYRGGVTLAIGRGTSHLDLRRGPLTQLAPLFVWHPPGLGACTHLCWTWHGGGDGVVCLLHVALYDIHADLSSHSKETATSLASLRSYDRPSPTREEVCSECVCVLWFIYMHGHMYLCQMDILYKVIQYIIVCMSMYVRTIISKLAYKSCNIY